MDVESEYENASTKTYRFVTLVTFRSIEGIVVLCNVQVQEVLVWEVLLALRTAVHMRLLVVHVVCIKRVKSEGLVRGK
jgi:hypothetical protein